MLTRIRYEVVGIEEVPLLDMRESRDEPRPMVLLVHEDQTVAESLATILTMAGFAVLTAYDGRSALEIARVIPPELLICDGALGEMSGVELAKRVVQATPDCRVVLFSSFETSAEMIVASEGGLKFAALDKPVHPVVLLKQMMASVRCPGVLV